MPRTEPPSERREDEGTATEDGASDLVAHFFRRSYGRLVATLSGSIGFHRIELIEDVVQEALLEALATWRFGARPENPTAWLFRVAKNRALDALKREGTAARLEPAISQFEATLVGNRQREDEPCFRKEIANSELRMMFACCSPELTLESRIAVILKLLCGLSTREIANALVVSEAAAQKRCARARRALARLDPATSAEAPPLPSETNAVHQALYLLFNEGYSSGHTDNLIRRELCEEAIRLTELLADSAHGTPVTWALLSLQHFHVARFDARLDGEGRILLLADQDRTLWNREAIARGFYCLDRSGRGETLSAYHLQAALAAQHCLAPTFADTNWPAIVALYDQLLEIERSPVWELNRAVAVGEVDGPAAGRAALAAVRDRGRLEHYHLYHAVAGELARRQGDTQDALESFRAALDCTDSLSERALLLGRIESCAPTSAPVRDEDLIPPD